MKEQPDQYISQLSSQVSSFPSILETCNGVYFTKKGLSSTPSPKVDFSLHPMNKQQQEEEEEVLAHPQTRDYLSDYMKRPTIYKSDSKLRATYPAPPPIQDELCMNTPPPEIPPLTKELQEYTTFLHTESNKEKIRKGMFEYSVPEGLKEDYHNLNEYRSQHVRNAFCFAWAGYRELAWGYDEVQPVTGQHNNNWGGVGITLIDSIDTLILMGLNKEEAKAREFVSEII